MKRLIILLLILTSQIGKACDCVEFKQAQKQALANNKFILLNFSNSFNFKSNDLNALPIMNPVQENKEIQELLKNYIYVCANANKNPALIKRYNILVFPQLLIVDANGFEVYRFTDYSNASEFTAAIGNFMLPPNFFSGAAENLYSMKSISAALRLAQKYLDYSLLMDKSFKANSHNAANSYIKAAENTLSKKNKDYSEKQQKIDLIKLYQWAYEKNFSFLNEKLAIYDESTINQSNINSFYFLKYITAKGLKSDDFPEIKTKTKQLEGFDYFLQKADLILNSN